MYRLLLAALAVFTLNSTCYAAEPSYNYILEEAQTTRLEGDVNKAQRILGRFVALSAHLAEEYNIDYAVQRLKFCVVDTRTKKPVYQS